MSKLFTPFNLAGTQLKNRIVMAPMTRPRLINTAPGEFATSYYAQRASAGLLITEGLAVSAEGRGHLYTMGIYNKEHVAGWRTVTNAVHANHGRIFAQIGHAGRMSHVSLQPGHAFPVSSGIIPATGTTVFALTASGHAGPVTPSQPRVLETNEISRITGDFVKSAELAIEAGFDGIEIMAANGFIFDQFLSSALNQRTDDYGGTVENRQRFLIETIDAVSATIGGKKVGVRLSPFGRIYDLAPYEGEEETWTVLANKLGGRNPGYVHLCYQPEYISAIIPYGFKSSFRQAFGGTLIGSGDFTRDIASAVIESGQLDLVAFGEPFIANTDLVERMKNGWPLAKSDRGNYYDLNGNPRNNYTGYPVWYTEQKH